MWTFLVLCCVIISHTAQGADPRYSFYNPTTWYPTTTGTEATEQPSCRYNCGSHMGSCSCSSSCQWNGNCCNDYNRYCYDSTDYYPITDFPRTPGRPSCRYNCGQHMGSCSCSSSCKRNGNCCYNYDRYCYDTTTQPTTTYPGTTDRLVLSSCQNSCGDHMGSCSCSSSCKRNKNCCYDYDWYCHETTTYYPETTSEPSCLYNCGDHMGSCSCSGSCKLYGNCCYDYDWYCYESTTYPTTTEEPTTDTPEPTHWYSCLHNCGYNLGVCSCTSSCKRDGSCCYDYEWYCYETTTYYPATTEEPSCRSYCGYNMGSCSCSSSCQWNGNCCHDYYRYCYESTTYYPEYPTTTYPETTSGPSCWNSCGDHMGSCSCSSSCKRNGNCCYDYDWYCFHTTTYYPESTKPISCRYNCGQHMGSCSCSSSCQWNGNCCYDYYDYCYSTSYYTTGHYQTDSTDMPCGGSLFGSGTFSSPNHPNNYNNNAYCVWHLSAVNDHRVFLSFSYLELENCCSCDYISVYDGQYTSNLLGKVCNDSHLTFQSSSKYMTVVFRTDSSVVARGFKADFLSSLSPSSGQVTCSSDMNIVIERSYLNSLGYDADSLYLNDPDCRPRVTYNQVVFNYPIDTCGNVRKIENGRVVYTNAVRAFPDTDGEITRQSHFTLKVGCRMEQDSVSQIMYLVHNLNNSSMTGTGRFNTSMDFYTSSSFYYKVTQKPYVVTLNQNLYVQVDLKGHEKNLVVYIDTCVTSPSPHDFQDRAYYLVRNGCPSDSTYRVYSSGSHDYARFTFKAFQFLRASESMYIQCKVRVCEAYNTSRCRPTGCNRRFARDLGSEDDSHTLVLGPIELKGPEEKEEETQEQDKA